MYADDAVVYVHAKDEKQAAQNDTCHGQCF